MAHTQLSTTGGAAVAFADLFGEDVIDETVRMLSGLAAKAVHVPIVHRVAGKILARVPIANIRGVATGFKMLSRGLQALSKRAVRNKLEAKGVNKDLAEMLVDTIDDTFEAITRHVDGALTQENVAAYVETSVNAVATRHGIITPSTNSASAPAAANHGVHMPETKLGPPADFSLAEFQQALSPLGKRRWAVFNRDYITAAAPGTSALSEPVSPRELDRAVTIAVWRDEGKMLDVLDDDTVDDETALWGFVGTAKRYVGDGETRRADQIGDAVDALTTGRTRETVRNGVDTIARGAVWATPRLAVFVAIVIMGSILVSAALVVIGAWQGYHGLIENGVIKIALGKMVVASLCIVGAGAALVPLDLVVSFVENRWNELVEAATGPFKWAGNVIKSYAAARGFPIHETETGAQ